MAGNPVPRDISGHAQIGLGLDVSQYNAAIASAASATQRLIKGLESLDNAFARLTRDQEVTSLAQDKLNKLMEVYTTKFTGAAGKMREWSTALQEFVARTDRAAFALASFTTAASATALVVARSMNNVATAAATAEVNLKSLAITAKNFGKDAGEAAIAAQELTKDGILSLSEASAALRNLLSNTSVSVKQATDLINGLKDAAAANPREGFKIGDQILRTTEGIRLGLSSLSDNAGIPENLTQLEEKYAASLGKTRAQLTEEEKILGRVVEMQKLTAMYSGALAARQQTLLGVQDDLTATWVRARIELGEAFNPVVSALTEALRDVVHFVEFLATNFKGLFATIGTGTVALTGFAGLIGVINAGAVLVSGALAAFANVQNLVALAISKTKKEGSLFAAVQKEISILTHKLSIEGRIAAQREEEQAIATRMAKAAEDERKATLAQLDLAMQRNNLLSEKSRIAKEQVEFATKLAINGHFKEAEALELLSVREAHLQAIQRRLKIEEEQMTLVRERAALAAKLAADGVMGQAEAEAINAAQLTRVRAEQALTNVLREQENIQARLNAGIILEGAEARAAETIALRVQQAQHALYNATLQEDMAISRALTGVTLAEIDAKKLESITIRQNSLEVAHNKALLQEKAAATEVDITAKKLTTGATLEETAARQANNLALEAQRVNLQMEALTQQEVALQRDKAANTLVRNTLLQQQNAAAIKINNLELQRELEQLGLTGLAQAKYIEWLRRNQMTNAEVANAIKSVALQRAAATYAEQLALGMEVSFQNVLAKTTAQVEREYLALGNLADAAGKNAAVLKAAADSTIRLSSAAGTGALNIRTFYQSLTALEAATLKVAGALRTMWGWLMGWPGMVALIIVPEIWFRYSEAVEQAKENLKKADEALQHYVEQQYKNIEIADNMITSLKEQVKQMRDLEKQARDTQNSENVRNVANAKALELKNSINNAIQNLIQMSPNYREAILKEKGSIEKQISALETQLGLLKDINSERATYANIIMPTPAELSQAQKEHAELISSGRLQRAQRDKQTAQFLKEQAARLQQLYGKEPAELDKALLAIPEVQDKVRKITPSYVAWKTGVLSFSENRKITAAELFQIADRLEKSAQETLNKSAQLNKILHPVMQTTPQPGQLGPSVRSRKTNQGRVYSADDIDKVVTDAEEDNRGAMIALQQRLTGKKKDYEIRVEEAKLKVQQINKIIKQISDEEGKLNIDISDPEALQKKKKLLNDREQAELELQQAEFAAAEARRREDEQARRRRESAAKKAEREQRRLDQEADERQMEAIRERFENQETIHNLYGGTARHLINKEINLVNQIFKEKVQASKELQQELAGEEALHVDRITGLVAINFQAMRRAFNKASDTRTLLYLMRQAKKAADAIRAQMKKDAQEAVDNFKNDFQAKQEELKRPGFDKNDLTRIRGQFQQARELRRFIENEKKKLEQFSDPRHPGARAVIEAIKTALEQVEKIETDAQISRAEHLKEFNEQRFQFYATTNERIEEDLRNLAQKLDDLEIRGAERERILHEARARAYYELYVSPILTLTQQFSDILLDTNTTLIEKLKNVWSSMSDFLRDLFKRINSGLIDDMLRRLDLGGKIGAAITDIIMDNLVRHSGRLAYQQALVQEKSQNLLTQRLKLQELEIKQKLLKDYQHFEQLREAYNKYDKLIANGVSKAEAIQQAGVAKAVEAVPVEFQGIDKNALIMPNKISGQETFTNLFKPLRPELENTQNIPQQLKENAEKITEINKVIGTLSAELDNATRSFNALLSTSSNALSVFEKFKINNLNFLKNLGLDDNAIQTATQGILAFSGTLGKLFSWIPGFSALAEVATGAFGAIGASLLGISLVIGAVLVAAWALWDAFDSLMNPMKKFNKELEEGTIEYAELNAEKERFIANFKKEQGLISNTEFYEAQVKATEQEIQNLEKVASNSKKWNSERIDAMNRIKALQDRLHHEKMMQIWSEYTFETALNKEKLKANLISTTEALDAQLSAHDEVIKALNEELKTAYKNKKDVSALEKALHNATISRLNVETELIKAKGREQIEKNRVLADIGLGGKAEELEKELSEVDRYITDFIDAARKAYKEGFNDFINKKEVQEKFQEIREARIELSKAIAAQRMKDRFAEIEYLKEFGEITEAEYRDAGEQAVKAYRDAIMRQLVVAKALLQQAIAKGADAGIITKLQDFVTRLKTSVKSLNQQLVNLSIGNAFAKASEDIDAVIEKVSKGLIDPEEIENANKNALNNLYDVLTKALNTEQKNSDRWIKIHETREKVALALTKKRLMEEVLAEEQKEDRISEIKSAAVRKVERLYENKRKDLEARRELGEISENEFRQKMQNLRLEEARFVKRMLEDRTGTFTEQDKIQLRARLVALKKENEQAQFADIDREAERRKQEIEQQYAVDLQRLENEKTSITEAEYTKRKNILDTERLNRLIAIDNETRQQKGLLQKIGDAWRETAGTVSTAWKQALNDTTSVAQTADNFITALRGNINALGAGNDKLRQAASETFNISSDSLLGTIDKVTERIRENTEAIVKGLNAITNIDIPPELASSPDNVANTAGQDTNINAGTNVLAPAPPLPPATTNVTFTTAQGDVPARLSEDTNADDSVGKWIKDHSVDSLDNIPFGKLNTAYNNIAVGRMLTLRNIAYSLSLLVEKEPYNSLAATLLEKAKKEYVRYKNVEFSTGLFGPKQTLGSMGTWSELGFASGGLLPDLPQYDNMPVRVHKGEMILPRDITQPLIALIRSGGFAVNAGSSIIINVNNPVVREEQDIKKITNAISNQVMKDIRNMRRF